VYIQAGQRPQRPGDGDVEFMLRWISDYRRLLSEPEKISAWMGAPASFTEILQYLDKAEQVYRSLTAQPRRWNVEE
jgi:hypothetical protein